MKKAKLKNWVVNLILITQCVLFIFLGAECNNLKIYLLSKIIIFIIMIINHLILYKYSNLFEENI